MLFSYNFFTFSQFPNKFYSRKSTSTHTLAPTENPPLSTKNPPPHNTKTTKTPPPTPPQQQQKNQRSKKERLRDWGKERYIEKERSVFSGGDEIGLGWWRRCMACSRAWLVVGYQDRSSTSTRWCMASDRRGGSWVFVDQWWGKSESVMVGNRWWERSGLVMVGNQW